MPPYTAEKWRKCMGIEPTSRLLDRRPSGFEDRAGHQPWTHFRPLFLPCFNALPIFFLSLCTTVILPGHGLERKVANC